MSRAARLLVVLVAAAGALLAGSCRGERRGGPANLILISIDTLRADHLGCYGYDRPTSPTLDRLAANGVLFEDVSATSPWTLPSHGSLLTGRYPRQIGLSTRHGRLPEDVDTLATILSGHGFATAAITNSLYLSRKYGFERGFDHFRFVEEGYTTTGVAPTIVEQALAWMRSHEDGPFFLFLHFYDLHSDYRPLPEYAESFARPYDGIADGSGEQLIAVRKGRLRLDQRDADHLIDLYDASIRQLDDDLGVLLESLREAALLADSLVVVTADHGEEFLDHGGVLHSQTQYQEMLHVPLILHGRGIAGPTRLNEVASLVDVLPTVLSILDVSAPPRLAGLDLAPLWTEPRYVPPERFVFAEADKNNREPDTRRAVRQNSYKLYHDRLAGETRLFDLARDPGERRDVAFEVPDRFQAMRMGLEEFESGVARPTEPVELTPEEVEKLRSLGYVQ